MEKKKFIPREVIPEKNNLYYRLKKYGGVSPCIAGKPANYTGSALANCVGYAFSRFAEMHGHIINVGCYDGNDYPASAQSWWDAPDGLERGQVIKLGAIACWKKNGRGDGHVAIVERIVNNGTECFLSDSAYGGAYFRYYPFTSDMKKAGYIFQGFIYPQYDFYIEEEKKSVDEIAQEVIDGKWGVQPDRQKRLVQAGYDYYEVQNKVNEILWEQKNYYTVQQGDTLNKIAKKTGTTVRKLMQLNNLKIWDIYHLYKGQKLRIK